MKKKLLAVVIGAACCGIASPAFAITDEEGNASIQFSFVPPGARSLGMGGAFLGRADDATAAYTNPAGLTQLTQFEISAEGRHTSYDSEFVSGGTFDSDPFDISGLDYSRADSSVNNFSYLSVVWPHESWSVAFFRHELAKYESEYVVDDIIAADGSAVFGYAAGVDLDIVNYGLSGAWQLTDDFSLGASLIYSDFEFESATIRPPSELTNGFFTAEIGDDKDIAFNVGALWRLSPKWQLGAVYRDGPSFDVDAVLANLDLEPQPGFPRRTSFNAPSVYGIGLSYQPTDQWTFTFDVNRVRYSELTDDMISGFRTPGDTAADQADIDPLGIDDGTELRLGAEYTVLTMANPFSLRAGVWRDPEHVISFDGEPNQAVDSNALGNAVIFSTGDDELHYTFGIGAVFGRFQIDAAADFSENIDTISVSGVLRFD